MDCKSQFFEKPKGRTIFEYRCGNGFGSGGCELSLHFDGRVYIYYENMIEHEPGHYDLVAISKPLANEVKKYIKENERRISEFPKNVPLETLAICDGSEQYYKFMGSQFGGYMAKYCRTFNDVEALYREIIGIFRKHKVFVDFEYQSEVITFVNHWSSFMDKIVKDKSGRTLNGFVDSMEFADECRTLGFEMDCGQSFNEKYGERFFIDSNEPLEVLFARIDDRMILGNMIYSQWRYYNHWSSDPAREFNPQWFKAALERLGEIGKRIC